MQKNELNNDSFQKKSMPLTQYEKMTQTPIPNLVLGLSVPTMISMLITNVYNLADTAFVGKLGTSASGAVGIVFGFMAILQAIGFLFGQGCGSILSRKLGQKDEEGASVVASTGFFAAFILALIVEIICFFFLDDLVIGLGSTITIAPYAKTYITYILFAAPFVVTSFTLNNILRYEGKAMLGMIGMMSGAILNIGGDALLMFYFHLGIAGAGISTAVSQLISFGILLSMFLRGKTQCKISPVLLLAEGTKITEMSLVRRLADICSTGFPSLLRQGLTSITTVLLNSNAAVYGDEAVAAMSIVSRITFFVFSLAIGIGQGFQPVSGFNYGAKKYGRLRNAFWFTFYFSEILMIVLTIVLLILSGDLIQFFRDDVRVIEIGTRALRLQGLGIILIPFCMVTEMMMQSTGQKWSATFLSASRNGVFFIPALLLLARFRGLAGIQEAQLVSNILSLIPTIIIALWFFKKIPLVDNE